MFGCFYPSFSLRRLPPLTQSHLSLPPRLTFMYHCRWNCGNTFFWKKSCISFVAPGFIFFRWFFHCLKQGGHFRKLAVQLATNVSSNTLREVLKRFSGQFHFSTVWRKDLPLKVVWQTGGKKQTKKKNNSVSSFEYVDTWGSRSKNDCITLNDTLITI